MYNLLVKGSPWVDGSGTFGSDRIVTYTDDAVKKVFVNEGVVNYDSLMKLPTLFVEENNYQRENQQFARIGRVTNVRAQRTEVTVSVFI